MHHSKRIVLSAAYGMGNVGDEAVCTMALADIFAVVPDAHITVLVWSLHRWRTAHPEWIRDSRVTAHPAFFHASQLRSPGTLFRIVASIWNIARCDHFLWGGGGLIRNRTNWIGAYLWPLRVAALFRKPIGVLSVGVEHITNTTVRRLLAPLNAASSVTVRDAFSGDALIDVLPALIDRTAVIPDGTFHFPAVERTHSSECIIGLNICNWDGRNRIDETFTVFSDRLAAILRHCTEGRVVRFLGLPTDPRDCAFIRDLAEKIPECPFAMASPATPEEYVRMLSRCALFIGMRMHSLILASRVQGLPFCGFIYSDKVRHLLDDAHVHSCFWPMRIPDADSVVSTMRAQLEGNRLSPGFSSLAKRSLHQKTWIAAFLATDS